MNIGHTASTNDPTKHAAIPWIHCHPACMLASTEPQIELAPPTTRRRHIAATRSRRTLHVRDVSLVRSASQGDWVGIVQWTLLQFENHTF